MGSDRGYDTSQLYRIDPLKRMPRLAEEIRELLRCIACPNCSREIPWAMRHCPQQLLLLNLRH